MIRASLGTALSLAFLLLSSVPLKSLADAPIESTLQKLVEIPSGTQQHAAVDQVQGWLADRLKKLGFHVDFFENPNPGQSARLLVGTRSGAGPRKNTKPITFIVHADTVFEPSTGFLHWKESKDPKVITGPGVIDDKGGILVALTGLEKYLEIQPNSSLSFRFISSPSEEVGSTGFLDRFREYAKDSSVVLGFEPALDDGSIVSGRRGDRWYDIQVTGREAHAGRSHREGVNACQALAIRLVDISKLTDYGKDLTVSIGHIEGGQDKFNIVCGSADAKLDTRFSDLASRDEMDAKIREILEKKDIKAVSDGEPVRVKYTVADDCPPFDESPRSKFYVDEYARILSVLEGKPVEAKRSEGSADSNYFSTPTGIVLDGLGPRGGKMHTQEEWLMRSSLETRSQALTQFLAFLQKAD